MRMATKSLVVLSVLFFLLFEWLPAAWGALLMEPTTVLPLVTWTRMEPLAWRGPASLAAAVWL